MSNTKAQLVSPVGILTASGISASGIITATSFVGDGTNLSGTGIGTTASINTSGIITATSFFGDGTELTGAGIGTEGSVNTSGIVTASAFVGDGSGITNPGGTISVVSFQPPDGATGVGIGTTITITFNRYLQAGVGTVYIREGSVSGTIFQQFNVGTSSSITFNAGQLIIDPTGNLGYGTTYFVVVDAGAVKDVVGLSSNTLIDTYSFTTTEIFYPLFAWGANSTGQLGQNNTILYSSPVQISGTSWNSLGSGEQHSLATKTDNTLWAWGQNNLGQLAQNNRTQYSSPTQIPGTSWSSISGGGQYSLATKTDGTLWSWGYNDKGQLGQSNRTPYSSPVQIPGTQWSSVSAGQKHSLATKTDGTLWSWGYNDFFGIAGQLGQNNQTPYSSPVQIPGTSWSFVSAGDINSSAIKTDGTLWVWGANNTAGRLGLNNKISYSSPVQVPGTQWSFISTTYNSIATKSDGTLWSWGYNNQGQLGQNDVSPRSSPVQIPGTSWSLTGISESIKISAATKTDGTLWVWGRNAQGQLGLGNRTYYSSPIQVPGTQWNSINVDFSPHSLAIKAE